MPAQTPIRQWRIRNIKSVERVDLDLAPLTVIVGANSSGKSTVLQSILLTVQAAQSSAAGGVFPLNGVLVQLGEFKDAHSVFAGRRRSSLGATFNLGRGVGGEFRTVDWDVDFSGNVPLQPGSTNLTAVTLTVREGDIPGSGPVRLALTSTRSAQQEGDDLRLMPGARVHPGVVPSAANIVRWGGTVRHGGGQNSKTRGLNLVAGFPTHYLLEVGEHEELANRWLANAEARVRFGGPGDTQELTWVRPGDPGTGALADIATHDIRRWLDTRKEGVGWQGAPEFASFHGASAKPELSRSLRIALSDAATVDALRRAILERLGFGEPVLEPESLRDDVGPDPVRFLAERVTYLGPLRQEPQFVYRTVAPGQPRFLGTKGEYLAPVLHRLRQEPVTVPMPAASVDTVPLGDAVSAWLAWLDAATSIEVRDTGRLGYDVRVGQEGLAAPIDLTSVGVGVSQVIPVVLACLIAEPGTVILLEQPELHLHPAMQQRLADFFLAIAQSGRQLLVETHSEYLVTVLRRHIAEDRTSRTSDLIQVVNAAKQEGKTTLTPIVVNRFGSIEEWPAGFFDQAAEESQRLLRAALEKRSAG